MIIALFTGKSKETNKMFNSASDTIEKYLEELRAEEREVEEE